MIAKKLSLALPLAGALLNTHHVLAFTFPYTHHALSCQRTSSTSCAELSMTSSFFADATSETKKEEKVQVDANGKVFTPGASVEISSKNVKAYHVHKAAYGSFDPTTKEFIPLDESNKTRATSCLILPTGLRGDIQKIYNTNEWDRAHPILVKFKAGADREGEDGFHLPKAFTMHVDADEIVVLDS